MKGDSLLWDTLYIFSIPITYTPSSFYFYFIIYCILVSQFESNSPLFPGICEHVDGPFCALVFILIS